MLKEANEPDDVRKDATTARASGSTKRKRRVAGPWSFIRRRGKESQEGTSLDTRATHKGAREQEPDAAKDATGKTTEHRPARASLNKALLTKMSTKARTTA